MSDRVLPCPHHGPERVPGPPGEVGACPDCGWPVQWCARCSGPNRPEHQYCVGCGTPLGGSASRRSDADYWGTGPLAMVALPDPPPEPSAAADLAAIGLVGSYIALGHDGIRLLPMQGGPALVLPVEGAGLARIEARRRELVWVEREGGHVQAPILPGNIEARRASPGDRAPLLGPRSWSPRTSEAPGAWSVEIWLDPPAGSLVDRYQRERGAFPRWFVRVRRAGEVVLRRRFQRLFHRPTLLRGHLVGSGVAPDLGSADPVVFAIPVAGHV